MTKTIKLIIVALIVSGCTPSVSIEEQAKAAAINGDINPDASRYKFGNFIISSGGKSRIACLEVEKKGISGNFVTAGTAMFTYENKKLRYADTLPISFAECKMMLSAN